MNLQPPAVGPIRPIKVPTYEERTLRNGLRVLAVRRPTVPRVEVRLRVSAGSVFDPGDGARARLLPEVLLAGTSSRSSVDIAEELQRLGASMEATSDVDDLVVGGGTLAGTLPGFLDLLAEVLGDATFPGDEVAIARDRVAQEIIIARTQPQAIASQAFRRSFYGRHRYGRPVPKPEAIRRIGRGPIERFYGETVKPRGATLVLVGDLRPARTIELVEQVFSTWKGRPSGTRPAVPTPNVGGPTLFVDRPGSVQTTIRVGGPVVNRTHPDFYKVSLANMVFGGYFTSRLVQNIRESKGYTYSPNSRIDHRRASSAVIVSADVGTEVTAASLVEIDYELARMTALPVKQEELDQARRYSGGVTALSIQTQGGLASMLDALLVQGIGPEYLKEIRARLQQVTVEDVLEVSSRIFPPRTLLTVLVGDAERVIPTIETARDVRTIPAP